MVADPIFIFHFHDPIFTIFIFHFLSIKDRDTGKELCRSHNFYKEEITELIEKAGFKIVSFKRTLFTSYHGDKKIGMMIITKNN